MKVLWIVNTIFPYPSKQLGKDATCFGGWLISLHEELIKNKDIKIAIASTYSGKDFIKYDDGTTIYYLVPERKANKLNNSMNKYFKEIVENFNPDLVHIHGTEYPRGLCFIKLFSNIKSVVSIQGLAYSVAREYYGGIPITELIKNISFRDIIKTNTIFSCKRDFVKRGVYEKEIIKKCNYIIGRTTWDKSNVLAISPNKEYFKINEILRATFYEEKKWNINNIERYSLYCSQASYPIKGLHILLDSMHILKEEYPNIKLYIGGSNIIDKSTLFNRIKMTGYGKLILKKIIKLKLEENIVFTGYLNEKEVHERLLKTHIFISPSFIENESNALSEASIVGVPSIASYVGGVTDRIIHEKTGFFYPPNEPSMLAYYIKKYFSNDNLSKVISQNSIEVAEIRNNKEKNAMATINAYKKISEIDINKQK